jgi:hypothetical protein
MKTCAGKKPTIGPTIVQVLRQLFIYVLSFSVAMPPAWMMSAVVHTETAEASTYALGYSKYQKGDFKGAEQALRQSFSKNPDKATQGKTYKLLGICQYMLGNKNGATDSFRRALQLVPSTRVSPTEVLDESVVGFFNGVESRYAKTAKTAVKKATKKTPKQAAAPAAAPAKTASAGGSKPLKKTFLKVLSNVANASISIDGILAGQVNSLINTDPGKITIEVTAPGYKSKTVSVNISPNQENTITVNLMKPQPKPKPKPKPKIKPQPKQKPTLAKAKKKKKKKKGNKYAPDPGGDMFDEPGGGGGGGPQGPDLATQFDADAGGYPQQPGYGAPPPQYYAPPPPQYYAPPPQYYAPPPQYYAPPPPPPPPADPYAGGGYAGDPGGGPPVDNAQDPAGPAPAGDGSGGDGGSSGNNLFISLLPFGAGQFQNGSIVLGLFFLGAEGAAIYYYMSKSKEADEFAATANTYIKENCQSEDSDEETCQKFQADSTAYVSDLRKKSQMGIAGFVGLWVVGAAEAIINEPKPEPATKKKKKRRYGGFAYTPTQDGHHFSLLGHESKRSLFAYDLGVNVVPAGAMNWTPEHGEVFGADLGREIRDKNELSLSLTLEF